MTPPYDARTLLHVARDLRTQARHLLACYPEPGHWRTIANSHIGLARGLEAEARAITKARRW